MTNTNREEWEEFADRLRYHAAGLERGIPHNVITDSGDVALLRAAAEVIETQGREIADLKTQPEMLLTYWREEVADYPLNTAAAQRLRLCIAELEGVLQSPTQAPLQEGATT